MQNKNRNKYQKRKGNNKMRINKTLINPTNNYAVMDGYYQKP